jgi:HPt (histidine-containing phosphotransfer) domain-containing protein
MKTPKRMRRAKDAIAIVTYGDHEVITPENRLRGAVSTNAPGEPHDDPVARAEKALAQLSCEFGSWMDSECDRLDKARRAFATDVARSNADALFHAAHDIKGEAATFGYPAIASAAESLCRLIEYTPDTARIPLKLIDQHVDAVRAIYREYARSDAKELAATLTKRLHEVTGEFLRHENRGRSEVLDQLKGPSIVPE